jgi:putative DNA methylase
MHIWWSRKPTGLARAVLFASIIDDPVDQPARWPAEADRYAERQRLLDLLAELARWNCPSERVDEARRLVADQCGGEPPTVIDPFCGGGVIPLEAVRLGLEVAAVDLNPVAALITKGLVEIPRTVAGLGPVHPRAVRPKAPVGGEGVAADIAAYGEQLLASVSARIEHHYPPIAGSPVVSYLWARTATCANPACGAEVPLLSTWWLAKARGRLWHVVPVPAAVPASRAGGRRRIGFEVRKGPPPPDLEDLKVGNGANYRCPTCEAVTNAAELRTQGMRGELGLRMVAVQTFADPERRRGRSWVSADEIQATAALQAWPDDRVFPVAGPGPPLVSGNMASFGFDTIEKLLTPRQRLLMVTMCDVLRELEPLVEEDARRAGLCDDDSALRDGGGGARGYAEAVTTYLALVISRMANRVSTMTVHNRANGSVEQSFVQPGYAFYGDFPEANPFSGSTGSFANSLKHVVAAVAALPVGPSARVTCGSAVDAVAPGMQGVVCTDPPYYDMFDYSALSNLFYAWLRLALRDIWPSETVWPVAPDVGQIVSNQARFDGDRALAHAHFETGLREAVAMLRAAQLDGFPLSMFYGYQQTQRRENGRSSDAWEVLLGALIDAGFQIVSTWPLRSERPEGVKTGSNSLASSILLVCRVRPTAAETLSREDFVARLRASLREAVRTFQHNNITPVDLAQSAIGPGMVNYSSCEQVHDADGSRMQVRTALELINRVLDETVAEPDAEYDAETRWAIGWFEDRGREAGDHETAERLAAAEGTSVRRLEAIGIVTTESEKVRLSDAKSFLARVGDPTPEVSIWERTQRLCHLLAEADEQAAARLLHDLDRSTVIATKALIYRLFLICNQRRWTAEAVMLNTVVRTWPTLENSP